MLNKELLDALNEQMNHEFYAAHAYMAMAAFCDDNSYEGFANFYIQQAKEERFHGKKIYDYINDRGEHALFTAIPAPKTEFSSILETFEDALAQAVADVQASEKPDAIFVIGGGEIFKQTMNIADRLELTHVELDVQGDAYYPEIPAEFKKVASEQHIDDKTGIAFEFATYRK